MLLINYDLPATALHQALADRPETSTLNRLRVTLFSTSVLE